MPCLVILVVFVFNYKNASFNLSDVYYFLYQRLSQCSEFRIYSNGEKAKPSPAEFSERT